MTNNIEKELEAPLRANESVLDLDGAIQGSYDEASGEYEWWKPIDDSYWVSTFGRVWSEWKKNFKKTNCGPGGYFSTVLHEKTKRVHRLVATAFIPNPDEKPFVNHIDGDRQNNHVSNLEWCTPSENTRHAYETGLMNIGTYLSNEERGEIKKLYATGEYTRAELCKKYNVCHSVVKDILKDAPIPDTLKVHGITNKIRHQVAEVYHEGKYSTKEIAEMFNVSTTFVLKWYHEFYNKKSLRPTYSEEFRKEVADTYHLEGTRKEIADMFGIDKKTVGIWHKKFYGNCPPVREKDKFRKEVADVYHEGNLSQKKIAESFEIDRHTVSNWHKKFYGTQKSPIREKKQQEALKRGKEIADAYHTGNYTQQEIADMFNVTKTTVARWHYYFYPTIKRRSKIAFELGREIANKYHEGDYTQEEVAEIFGVSIATVSTWHRKLYGDQKPQSE